MNQKALEDVQETLLLQAIQEGFITDDVVAIDATHFESRDQSTPQEKKPKSGAEETWSEIKGGTRSLPKKEKNKNEMNRKTMYEKTIENQLDVDLETLRTTVPTEPNWGIKKKIVKGRTRFGLDSKLIWQLVRRANIFFNP
ncbi:hypothetical protein GCM10020331_003790 [Ectobacillus funiculus]